MKISELRHSGAIILENFFNKPSTRGNCFTNGELCSMLSVSKDQVIEWSRKSKIVSAITLFRGKRLYCHKLDAGRVMEAVGLNKGAGHE